MSEAILDKTLEMMAIAVLELAKSVPQPIRVPFLDSFVYRHVEKFLAQAIVQKLVRLPSGLSSARLLLRNGYFQEQAVLQRVVDEISEDIVFLSHALILGKITPRHKEYLEYFFAEEFDLETGKPTTQDRPMVPRKKIRAYIAQVNTQSINPSGHIEAARAVSKTYSGFVHAASPQIMDMYFGDPPVFHVRGALGTLREAEYRRDIYNYFYRSTAAFALASMALRNSEQQKGMFKLACEYETLMNIQ